MASPCHGFWQGEAFESLIWDCSFGVPTNLVLIIQALVSLRQEDEESEDSLGCIESPI
jgi:hypothetical protein